MEDETVQKEHRAASLPVLDSERAGIESVRRFSSSALLQGERQVVIARAGREYRLRVASQGKLILTA